MERQNTIFATNRSRASHHFNKQDSIMDFVDTGFGYENILWKDCPRPKFKTHLFKENYLNEFKSDTEKTLVRHNLEVYSKAETNQIVSHLISEKNLVTKDNISEIIEDLNFVDSIPKSDVYYDIPDKLFKL